MVHRTDHDSVFVTDLLDCQDVFGDLTSEDGTVDQICFNLDSIEAVLAHVPLRIDQLPEMCLVVLNRCETDQVRPRRHSR